MGGGVDCCRVFKQMGSASWSTVTDDEEGCVFSRSDSLRSLTEEAAYEVDGETDGKQLLKFC